ncbi:MAG TPA: CDP-diacylglycerol diphosphatase [Steroidobacteraceae bacterium]
MALWEAIRMGRRDTAVAIATAVATAAMLSAAAVTEPQRDRLRLIVQQQCVPLWLKEHRADPCLSVSIEVSSAAARDRGYAILHDRKGGAHLLLISTRSITGIESPELEEPGAPNYFDAAWKARGMLASYLGHSVPRSAVGLAMNSIRARSQDQLHIHIECLGRGIFAALAQNAQRIRPTWSQITLDGWPYQALRIDGADLGAQNPVQLLAAGMPGDLVRAGQFTMLVAGMQYADGPGFAVLASTSAPGAELLLDSSCAVGAGPSEDD